MGSILGDTLRGAYAGVPFDWEREYAAALATIARCSGLEATLCAACNRHRGTSCDTTHVETRAKTSGSTLRSRLRRAPHQRGATATFCRSIAAFFGISGTLRAFRSRRGTDEVHQLAIPQAFSPTCRTECRVDLVIAESRRRLASASDERILTSTMVGHRKPSSAGFEAPSTPSRALHAPSFFTSETNASEIDGGATGLVARSLVVALARRTGGVGPDLHHSIPSSSRIQLPGGDSLQTFKNGSALDVSPPLKP